MQTVIDVPHSLILVLVMAAVTQLLRFLPFGIFSKGTPATILYLGKVLPAAIMGMLVVYCLKGTSFTGKTHGIPEIAAVLLTAGLHKWKHNTLPSIIAGTGCYMILKQTMG